MKLSVISQKAGQRRVYYYLKDEGNKKYFGKKIKYSNDKSKLLNEFNILKFFSNFPFTPKVKYFNLEDNIIIYEYIEGKNLKNQIVDIDEAVNIVLNICIILEVIHKHGYIFGDLKPSNIMIGEGIMLIDYECVTKIGEPLNYASKLYCSPYQKTNRKAIYQFDLFSLGMIFLELLIGYKQLKYYFDKNLISEIEPNKIIINLPNKINAIIKKLLSASLSNNYNNVLELKKDLQEYIKKNMRGKI